jgi:succinoglycan biosynthesis protein ExoA
VFALQAATWCALCIGYGLLLGIRARDTCAAASGIAAIATLAG